MLENGAGVDDGLTELVLRGRAPALGAEDVLCASRDVQAIELAGVGARLTGVHFEANCGKMPTGVFPKSNAPHEPFVLAFDGDRPGCSGCPHVTGGSFRRFVGFGGFVHRRIGEASQAA
jgi:hypothetical protein